MRKISELIAAAALLVFSAAASANIIYTWTADGMTESAGQRATAVFDFSSANSFTLTLTNNVSPTELIASELDGILFSLSSEPISIDLLSVTAQQVLDCTSSPSFPCPAGNGATPYGWGASLTGSEVKVGAGYSSGSGDFSFHPYGIINQNYNPGALGDPAYNPLLVGPVTYTFAMNGLESVPEINSATFLFGAVPDSIVGDPNGVPEPNSLALIGIAMLAFVWTSRRKRHKS